MYICITDCCYILLNSKMLIVTKNQGERVKCGGLVNEGCQKIIEIVVKSKTIYIFIT